MARTYGDHWRAEAMVDISHGDGGLIVRMDDRHWYEVRATAGRVCVVGRVGDFEAELLHLPLEGRRMSLFIESAWPTFGGPDDLVLGFDEGGTRHQLASVDGRYLSTEVAGGFTGRVVGVRAVRGELGLRSFRFTPR